MENNEFYRLLDIYLSFDKKTLAQLLAIRDYYGNRNYPYYCPPEAPIRPMYVNPTDRTGDPNPNDFYTTCTTDRSLYEQLTIS